MKDLEKRKRVMQRSIRLGHCICNPKQPCPCEEFKTFDVCHCAGESRETPDAPVRLTALVANPGCASKIDQASLKKILSDLPPLDHPDVLVGMTAGDDAGVFRLSDSLAIVQTVDVFCPSVDDPYTFGQIAAANSLSDVYAMGGRPITALSVVGYPIRQAPPSAMTEILRGGIDKMAEASVPVVGGHSINDPEIKAGFAVTGIIDPSRIITNSAAQPSDALVLTKPLGTGIVAFAAQIGRTSPEAATAAAESMASLNKTASELMLEFKAHACTDVTGFGLVGHLSEMARRSGVDVEITWDLLPLLPGVLQCAADGILPGGIERNRESSESSIVPDDSLSRPMLDICFDAQTSGGLLIALPAQKADDFVKRLRTSGCPHAARIGAVREKGPGRVLISTDRSRSFPEPKAPPVSPEPDSSCCPTPADDKKPCCAQPESPCCADAAGTASPSSAETAFKTFLSAASSPGALDVATKQALSLALSIVTRCEPCTRVHIAKARKMGFSQAEIDEAAWLAISFGGSPVMMFYNSFKDS